MELYNAQRQGKTKQNCKKWYNFDANANNSREYDEMYNMENLAQQYIIDFMLND